MKPAVRTSAAALFGALALASAFAPAVAADAKSVIEARRADFKKMGAAMKSLVEQSKAETPDKAKMAAAVQTITGYAPQVASWFPAGSGPGAGADTDALPYIWEARARFDELAGQLAPQAAKLSSALSGDDVAAIRAQVKALGGVCGECHKSYRAD